MDPSSIGMMEGAYFASKRELLSWLETAFGLQVTRIEQCGDGVAYLKVLDRLFPGVVPMRRVKLNASQEWERLHNLKLLQVAFVQCGIKKPIAIGRLAKCQQLDNLEFLQWLRSYYDRVTGSGAGFPPPSAASGSNVAMSAGPATSGADSGRGALSRPSPAPRARYPSAQRRLPPATHTDVEKLHAIIRDREKQLVALERDLDDVEHDVAFYYGKLRSLELACAEPGRTGFTVAEIEHVLYSRKELEAADGAETAEGETMQENAGSAPAAAAAAEKSTEPFGERYHQPFVTSRAGPLADAVM